jgi:hypothetical protein
MWDVTQDRSWSYESTLLTDRLVANTRRRGSSSLRLLDECVCPLGSRASLHGCLASGLGGSGCCGSSLPLSACVQLRSMALVRYDPGMVHLDYKWTASHSSGY